MISTSEITINIQSVQVPHAKVQRNIYFRRGEVVEVQMARN